MIFAPLFGYLGDRYSRKLIMAFGVFLWSLTTLLGSFMDNFWLFLMCRAMVGIGEASYSTVAPTIISDLFVKDLRSKMLALFYFAIPVGSGLGYIIGSVTASAAGSWQWGLRVTPILGGVAVLLILIVLRDPQRGQSEGGEHMTATSYFEDLRDISRNRSFILSTAGFTCVAFVAGALSWWGPTLLYRGVKLQPGNENVKLTDLSLPFGGVAMAAGIVGVTLGCFLSQWLVKKYPRADPQICAVGLLVSTPLLVGATFASTYNTYLTFVLLFFGEVALNLNWSLVCDILLYVVIPTRRSTAQGFQLLVSHALGDAGSPYFVGLISVALKSALNTTSTNGVSDTGTSVTNVSLINRSSNDVDTTIEFKSLQYAVFTTSFVEVLGGVFFLLTAIYVVKDKLKVEKAVRGSLDFDQSTEIIANDGERRSLMT